jgi:hypothetical protein
MPTTDTYRTEQGGIGRRQVKSDDEIASATVKARLSTTAGSGLGARGKAGKGPMPQQKDFATTGAWRVALQKWQAQPDAASEGQKRALGKLAGK